MLKSKDVSEKMEPITFILSQNTSVEVRASQFGNTRYVKIVRHMPACNEREARDRWINMNTTNWQALCTMIPAVHTNMSKLDEGKVTMNLPGNQRIEVSLYRGKYYVGFHVVDDEGSRVRGKGMNLAYEEFMQLVEFSNMIGDALKATHVEAEEVEEPPKKKAKKVKKDTRRVLLKDEVILPKVKQYRWCLSEVKGRFWFFSEEDCMADFKDWPRTACDGEVKVTFETREVQVPSPENLMRRVYTYLLRHKIRSLIREQCVGCLNDSPGQRNHMSYGGCLDVWENGVDLCFKNARLSINTDQLTTATQNILNIVSPTLLWGGELMALALLSMNEKEVKVDVTRETPEDEYERLFLMKLVD